MVHDSTHRKNPGAKTEREYTNPGPPAPEKTQNATTTTKEATELGNILTEGKSRERETEKQRQRDRKRDRDRETERERQRETETERDREREREISTYLER